jgi:L-threonylcarbamoyladenylate synthase
MATGFSTPRAGAGRWRWGEPLEPLHALLDRGGVLAIPTESSYGLAADPLDAHGVAAVYRLKGRAGGKPLPVVAADLDQLAALGLAVDEPLFRRLAAAWPAPLSLVVPAPRGLPAAAGGETLAVRLPGHPPLLRLLDMLGRPLTATSANRSGERPLTDPDELSGLLAGHDALIVDGGRLAGGPPSTLVALGGSELTVLRRGGYPMADLQRRVPELPMTVVSDARPVP